MPTFIGVKKSPGSTSSTGSYSGEYKKLVGAAAIGEWTKTARLLVHYNSYYYYYCSGFPGVMLGHNEKLSWGLTLNYWKHDDLFRVELDHCPQMDKSADNDKDQGSDDVMCYRHDGELVPIKFRYDTVKIKVRIDLDL